MKARYVSFFSYIGTRFRSSEKISLKERHYPDPESVQGLFELALLKLKSLNYPAITLSSRTDGGVHALNSSAHFDLDKYGTKIYDPQYITFTVNKYFFKNDISINLKKCTRVNDDFNARFNAIGRTYLFRLAVFNKKIEIPEYTGIHTYEPIEEWRRVYFIKTPEFDIEKFKEGAKYLVGYHDFTTFRRTDKSDYKKHNRRSIQSIEVKPGRALVTSYMEPQDSCFDYYDIEVRGRSFVHNQIRRMVGTLIAVASGKVQPEEVKVMLQIPSKHSWNNSIQNPTPHGLYLCDVHYNDEDLVYNPDRHLNSCDKVTVDDELIDSE